MGARVSRAVPHSARRRWCQVPSCACTLAVCRSTRSSSPGRRRCPDCFLLEITGCQVFVPIVVRTPRRHLGGHGKGRHDGVWSAESHILRVRLLVLLLLCVECCVDSVGTTAATAARVADPGCLVRLGDWRIQTLNCCPSARVFASVLIQVLVYQMGTTTATATTPPHCRRRGQARAPGRGTRARELG